MKKLEVGDYVKNLTKKQFDSILEMENSWCHSLMTHGIPGTDGFHENGLLFDRFGSINHARIKQCKNELTYRQFLSRAKNTFKL